MASPLSKKAVDMKAPAVRGSRIRRDPPPKVKPVSLAEIKERQARNIVIGVVMFALALFAVLTGFSAMSGWSLTNHPIHVRVDE